ncbi:GGDEF domain-containing protein [Desulfonema ishimotonii]|uniref:GGDEF domain-containing protein n=1 Tax=Desulfonema ishimotonii TaxID=45657 RepID=A0A401FXS7_9BACT|nr:EAL domain-containing protein [Desulfonema ishimotonii]GBC61756.1 GGDEF domain-containing protein [Desulfonema ishimotonii]
MIIALLMDNFYAVVSACGEDIGFRMLAILQEEALGSFARFFPRCQMISHENSGVNETILFFRLPVTGRAHLASAIPAFRLAVSRRFGERISELICPLPEIRAGYSRIDRPQGAEGFGRMLFRAYCNARGMAIQKTVPERPELYGEFTDILETPRLKPVYQPVADLRTGLITGWEAVVCAPEESLFHDANLLSDYADEIGKRFPLELRYRELALKHFGPADPQQHLFMNFHPGTLNAPEFIPEATRHLVREAGLRPENIVLEFSEACDTWDLSLLADHLERHRVQGFKIAISGMGTDHSDIRSISRIKPDYVKIAPSLTRGIDISPVRRDMVESFIALSRKIGFEIIAEGIETPTELSALISMEVACGQGNHIAEPAAPKPALCVSIPARLSVREMQCGALKSFTPICRLVQQAFSVSPDTPVCEVREMLANQPPMSSVVVVENRQPVGILMNYNLGRKLGTGRMINSMTILSSRKKGRSPGPRRYRKCSTTWPKFRCRLQWGPTR